MRGTLTRNVDDQQLADGVTKMVVRPGHGKRAEPGSRVKVHYTGLLDSDNSVFDSSRQRNASGFSFTLGVGEVIPGWDTGVAHMVEGEASVLTIAPHMGYGSRGSGSSIPPDSTLRFEIELLKVGDDRSWVQTLGPQIIGVLLFLAFVWFLTMRAQGRW